MARRHDDRPRGVDLDELLDGLGDEESSADALLALLPPAVASEVRLGTRVKVASKDAGTAKVWTVELDRDGWTQRHRLGFSRRHSTEADVRETFEVGFFRFMGLVSGGRLNTKQAKRFVDVMLSRKGPAILELPGDARLEVIPMKVPPGIRGSSADLIIVDDVEPDEGER